MSKCPQCGYELFPLDEVCDKCGATIPKSAPVDAKKAKKASKNRPEIFIAGAPKNKKVAQEKPARPKGVKSEKSQTEEKTSKAAKAEKAKSDKKSATAGVDKKATPKSGLKAVNENIIPPAQTSKKAGKEKPAKEGGGVKKGILIALGVIGGIIVVGGIAFFIAFTVMKSKLNDLVGDSEYFEDLADDFIDEYGEDFTPEDIAEYAQNFSDEGFEDDYYEEETYEDSEEYYDDQGVSSEEEMLDNPEEVYEEELNEPIEGSENLGKTFDIGKTFSYDNISYTVTYFNKVTYDDEEYEYDTEDDSTEYQIGFHVTNNCGSTTDVDVIGSYFENGVEGETYTSADKDSYATLDNGQSADLAVSVFKSNGASEGIYVLNVGMYTGEDVEGIKIRLF